MSIKQIEIQDNKGNSYYPTTEASVVKYKDITVDKALDNLNSSVGSDIHMNPLKIPGKNLIYNSNFIAWHGVKDTILTSGFCGDFWEIMKSNTSTFAQVDPITGGLRIQVYRTDKITSDVILSFDMSKEDIKNLTGRQCTFTICYSSDKIPEGDENAFKIVTAVGTIIGKNGQKQIETITGTFSKAEGYGKGIVDFVVHPESFAMDDIITIDYVKLELGDTSTPYIENDYLTELKKGYSYEQSFPKKILYCVNSYYLLGFTFPEILYSEDEIKVSVTNLKDLNGKSISSTLSVPQQAIHSYGIDFIKSSTSLTTGEFYMVDIKVNC